ncbi:MAG: hypothetical protein II794_01630, partial [Oscillospiraceae bacterium]|nr:hypothetical protein [Oscillospiraceae bacterium]
MKNKGSGFYFAAAAACLSLVTLVIVLIYGGRGGQVSGLVIASLIGAIVLEAVLLLGEKPWSDYCAIAGAVLLAFA